jgi:hypothetical protein
LTEPDYPSARTSPNYPGLATVYCTTSGKLGGKFYVRYRARVDTTFYASYGAGEDTTFYASYGAGVDTTFYVR